MPSTTPKVSVVRDNTGKTIIFLGADFGRDLVITRYGPRYQKYVLNGSPVTIHYDTQLMMFRVGPMCLKDGLNAPRYQHVVDLPEGVSYGDEDLDEELSDGPEEEPGEEPGEDGQAATTNINGGASTDFNIPPAPAVKIPRPPNSWILYRKDKSKELLEANPGMSTGAISTEASRQWKVENQSVKTYYQRLANEMAQLHKVKHPDYRYKPERK